MCVDLKKFNDGKINAYFILLLQTVFSAWSWVFLLFAAYSLAGTNLGGTISAALFLCNAIVRALLGRPLSRLSQSYQVQQRLYLSIVMRTLIMLGLLLLARVAHHPYILIIWFFFINIILVFDNYLWFHLKYLYNDVEHISLTRFNTLNNLGARGVIAISSVLAMQINSGEWGLLAIICIALALAGVIASCQAVFYSKNYHVRVKKPDLLDNETSYERDNKKSITQLAAVLLFCMNYFFGSGVLIFTLATARYHLITSYSFGLVTFFYLGFIAINIFGAIFDKYVLRFINWKNLLTTYYLTALIGAVLFYFQYQPVWCFAVTILWGVVYGWGITAFFILLSNQVRGYNQAALFARVDSASRLGYILSQFMTGVLLSNMIEPLKLLQLYSAGSMLTLLFILSCYRDRFDKAVSYEQTTM
jgi:hypothetical protein